MPPFSAHFAEHTDLLETESAVERRVSESHAGQGNVKVLFADLAKEGLVQQRSETPNSRVVAHGGDTQ